MEEREVELIDYLRTIWWGKWIILGCLVVAVGLSALFLGLQPTTTTYSGSTEILLREYVTAALDGDRDATAAMTDAVGFTLIDVETKVPDIAAILADDRITLSRSDAASTDAVSDALAQAEAVLEQQLPLALAKELEHLARVMRFERSNLVAELEILSERLREERASASAEDPVPTALAGRIAGLEEQLAQQQVRLDIVETAEPGDLFVLSPIGEPTSTSTVSKSRSKTTIAVAGFLGLMLGVLLAFFVHYLVQVNARERRVAKDERS